MGSGRAPSGTDPQSKSSALRPEGRGGARERGGAGPALQGEERVEERSERAAERSARERVTNCERIARAVADTPTNRTPMPRASPAAATTSASTRTAQGSPGT